MKILTHELVIYDNGWVFEWRKKTSSHFTLLDAMWPIAAFIVLVWL